MIEKGDFVSVNTHFFLDVSPFKNKSWARRSLPLRVHDILPSTDLFDYEYLVLLYTCGIEPHKRDVPFSPIKTKHVDLLWSPRFKEGDTITLKDDVTDSCLVEGTFRNKYEHMLSEGYSGRVKGLDYIDDNGCYIWEPYNQTARLEDGDEIEIVRPFDFYIDKDLFEAGESE